MASTRSRRVPTVEWILGFSSLAVLLGIIGYLVFEAEHTAPRGPVLRISIVSGVRPSGGMYVVDVVVRNESRAAAADVHVAGAARSDTGELVANAHLDYVPGRSMRQASLVFERHPTDVAARVVGYTAP